ncbi:MAG TPA: glycoside hydrolase family 97 catalytic domain-containing protein [Puia sp.]|nr:glycoside hydrolase family 97 catalytic domain-containing protein [Puia sp.]
MRITAAIAATLLLFCLSGQVLAQKEKVYDLISPGGTTAVSVTVSAGGITWSVRHGGQPVLAPSALALQLEGGETLDGHGSPVRVGRETKDEWILPLHYKKDSIRNRYDQLTLTFPKGRYGVIFRAYDDGAAYRWVTTRKDSLTIRSEKAEFNFPADEEAWIPYVNDPSPDIYTTSFENFYRKMRLSEFKKDTLAFLPVLVDVGGGRKVAILEADLEDYPGMFVEAGTGGGDGVGAGAGTGGGDGVGRTFGLTGRFAPYPLSQRPGGHNGLQMLVTRRADFLAATAGTRSFPWRIIVCSDHDRELMDNDMVYRLASPSRVTDTGWIKPGKVAWDWWNDWNISHVDFRAGINTDTYKYYIDFAADNHIGYILLDEGWSDPTDLMKIVPEIDLAAIIDYGRRRNVGVWLWAGMMPLDRDMEEVMGKYSQMGIRGFKVDFMNRDDQEMVKFYYRAAKEAAAHHLMLDFHGAYKPTGLQRTYPNVLNFEGVRGMENEKWSNDDFPGYDVSIPFIRMLAGPLDYTPGAMKNYNKVNFRPIFSEPESQGTRCHQLAMYIVYEAPFSMLSDNPTSYKREPESVQFITGVPSVFDETRALDGSVGEYAVVARRKGKDWYVGAMTNWSARDLTLDLSFLAAGSYRASIMRDGVNADRDGTDYKTEIVAVTKDSRLNIHLAPGGGWVAKISPGDGSVMTAPGDSPGAGSGTGPGGRGPATPPPMIDLNQVGFYPLAPKMAVVTVGAAEASAGGAGAPATDRFFVVGVSGGDTVFTGRLGPLTASTNSSLSTRLADFTGLQKAGVYCVLVPGMERSYPFRIGDGVLYPVVRAALKGYYYQRSGMALTPEYAGQWSRPAGHPDTQVLVHPSAATALRPAGTVISTPGGWYDAGDYNKYVVNSGITMGTLLDAYEDFPGFFDTLHTNIPPMPGVPDLLNEVLYNLRWMLTMQDPNDGGVYHKCTNAAFDGMVMPGVTKAPRYVVAKGTAATLDFAAVMAQAARVLRHFRTSLPGLSDSCLHAAVEAWKWAAANPDKIYDQDAMNKVFSPRITTGAYGDRHLGDEWFWAACELWITTLDARYYPELEKHTGDMPAVPAWSNVARMGDLTLLRNRGSMSGKYQMWLDSLQQGVLNLANKLVERGRGTAFHTVMGASKTDFVWGSNSVAANQGMLLVSAWLLSKDRRYLDAALGNLDYLLGRNATGYCFVTGIGTHSTMHPHHRPSVADGIIPPVPGLMAGGPNPGRQDHQRYAYAEPETSYTDQDAAYASNEIAINWNAPLVYLAGAIEALQGSL